MSDFDPYLYWCKPTRIVDGDSLYVTVDWGCKNYTDDVECRLYGVDTPEIRGKPTSWLDDRAFALDLGRTAKRFLELNVLDNWVPMRTHKDKDGSFGRLLVTLYIAPDYVVHAESKLDLLNLPSWGSDERLFALLELGDLVSVNWLMVHKGLARPNFYDAESERLRITNPPPRGV